MAKMGKFGISGIIGIVVAVVLASALVPPAINSATSAEFDERSQTFTLTEGDTQNLSDTDVNVTLDNVTSSPDTAEYTLANGGSETVSLEEDENDSVTIDGTDYNISVSEIVTDDNESTATVEYKTDNGGGVAADLWFMIPLFIVLAIALYFVSFVTNGRDGL